MARSGIVWNVLRVVLCPFKKYESKRERERERAILAFSRK